MGEISDMLERDVVELGYFLFYSILFYSTRKKSTHLSFFEVTAFGGAFDVHAMATRIVELR